MIQATGVDKSFTLHTQGGVVLPVLRDLDFAVDAGECIVLHGPSGCGKSTLLRSLYANYKVDRGNILIHHRDAWVDLAGAEPRLVLDIRRHTLGYVSQFLRVVPRVPALDVVAEPLRLTGSTPEAARRRASELLGRLRIPERLRSVAPATFSGGEQQRINLARGFAVDYPILLLDEPTASLDAANRATVVEMILEAKARGAAVVAICHDREARESIADRLFQLPHRREAA